MISISRMRELVEEQENKIKNSIEFIKPKKKKENKIKAYIVSDKWNEDSTVIFAESVGKAKSEALYEDEFSWHDYEYTELRARRMKKWDKYAETKKIPIAEMLQNGWWFYCSGICGKEINEDHIKDGEAVIIDDERNDFVQGNVICKECLKKRGGINANSRN